MDFFWGQSGRGVALTTDPPTVEIKERVELYCFYSAPVPSLYTKLVQASIMGEGGTQNLDLLNCHVGSIWSGIVVL
jgi:hypothetical protein